MELDNNVYKAQGHLIMRNTIELIIRILFHISYCIWFALYASYLHNNMHDIFALAGILAFSDKVMSEATRKDIKEVLKMNQTIKMIFDDGVEEGIEKGKIVMAKKMLKAGEPREKIREYTELSDEVISRLEEEACCLV